MLSNQEMTVRVEELLRSSGCQFLRRPECAHTLLAPDLPGAVFRVETTRVKASKTC